ncbi:HAD-superfamily subfamily IIA hydrolase [Ahrensia sp. R2A130]|nr:HAD-superfamily subfamily IIA hydrolase [Ahrensia sp. R2A130]
MTMTTSFPKISDGLSAIAKTHDALLCDVWGVLHNGVNVYVDAADALQRFRAQGGKVVMITNSPRPSPGVIAQFAELGVPDGVCDAVVTSGDVTRTLIEQAEGSVWLLGPERDEPLFDGLAVKRGDEAFCNTIVCTGLFHDEVETPEDYRTRLTVLAARKVPMICANPDLIVERGDRMIHCAGSLAKLYAELGGEVRIAGKPHAPIYALARKTLAELPGDAVDPSRIIAVGDGMPTDVKGAVDNGVDLLYISAGIHSAEYGPADNPDAAALEAFMAAQGVTPTAWMPRLTWQRNG